MNAPLCVGFTGGIGSGKTVVSTMFEELGVPVIDADVISRNVTRKNGLAFGPIIELFGLDLVSESGELQRDRLRELIFEDDSRRKQLESIIHPLVREEINRRINEVSYPYCIVSIPLLLETGRPEDFDRILIVDVPRELQISRVCERDQVKPEDVEKIIASQADRQARLEVADDVILNDGDLESAKEKVCSLHKKYLRLAREKV